MPRPEATILHVDMDAFYASVEVLLDPSLAGRPLIVGGSGRRGVVAAASYEARAFGVHSAMPSGQARRLCPQAIFVAGRYDRYSEFSRQIHEIFTSYTPLVEGIALDEAFLDVSGAVGLFGDGLSIGSQIRTRVKAEVGLDASVGVAASKFVAKLASEAAKPRASLAGVQPGAGVVLVPPGQELAFLHPKPVEALWGVGRVTEARLRGLGVLTIGDLAAVPVETLEAALGAAHGRHLHHLAWGRDERAVEPEREVKSIGHEETYAWDLNDRDDLHRESVRMADAVSARLRASGMAGRTVVLKVRYGDFTTITRSHTLTAAVDTGAAIARAAVALLDQVSVDQGVRLLGVSVCSLVRGPSRQLVFELGSPGPDPEPPAGHSRPPADRLGLPAAPADPSRHPEARRAARAPTPAEAADLSWHEATLALDAVRARFGETALGPAALLDPAGLRLKRQGDTQWGPSAPREPHPESPSAGPD